MPNVMCKVCRKEFYAKPSRILRGWGDYCSNACKYKDMFQGKTFACATCGSAVYRNRADIKKSKDGAFYCNKSCHAKAKNKLWAFGEEHFNWKGGGAVYRQVMLREGRKPICEDCGITDIRVLIVHHIDQNRKNNGIKNLRWLCRNCHYLVHEGKTF